MNRLTYLIISLFLTILATSHAFSEETVTTIREVPGDYRVTAGDLLEIKVFGADELNQIVKVTSGGIILLPLVGPVPVVGLSEFEIKEKIEGLLAEKLIQQPQVIITVRETGRAFIGGLVRLPKDVPLRPGATLINAISQAGGFDKDANVTEVRFLRKGAVPIVIDVESILTGKIEDPILMDGDAIYVEEAKNFYVEGYVRKPGAFPFKKGMTLLKAIGYAGGIDDIGKSSGIQISRPAKDGFEKITVDYGKIKTGKAEDIFIKKEDIIYVPRSYLASFIRGLFFSIGIGDRHSVGVNPSPWVTR